MDSSCGVMSFGLNVEGYLSGGRPTCNRGIVGISEDPNIILLVTIMGWGVHLRYLVKPWTLDPTAFL